MPRGGKLIIETSGVDLGSTFAQDQSSVMPGPYVVLSVTDTGVGMSAETMAHIFEPFYTTKNGERTGLGLATVYGIVKQTGGHIAVYSEHGKGSTFKVYLPRVAEAVHTIAAPDRADSRSVNGHETILLVEDERAVRELARRVLADRGYSVIEARNPEEALRLANDYGSEIHLLLTDVVMPGMSGYDLAKRLKAQLSDLRVLYVSGYAYDVFAEKGTIKGSAFLQKPFTPNVLAQRVRETLDRQVEQIKTLDPQLPDLRF
jgi:CheY-like chemotaxis protein